MSHKMARSKEQINTHSSSYRSKRRAIQESMLEYYTHSRRVNARDVCVDDLSRVTSVVPVIQPQFKDIFTDEAIFTRQHRHPDIVSLEPLHLAMEHEYYQTKRHQEYEIPLAMEREYYQTKRHQEYEIPNHGSKSQGRSAFTSSEHGVGFRSKNHMNANLNCVKALDQYEWAAHYARNNILKQESTRRLMEPRYGNSDQYGDHRVHRPRYRLDPLDFRSLEHDVNRDDLMGDNKQITIPLVKQFGINDSSFVSTDKKFQIDIGFRRKQLFSVVEDKNNAKLPRIASKLLDSTEKNDFKTNIRIASQSDFSQTHAESQYPGSASIPIRLLQRPHRAKRMDLHTPNLHVIPEAGDMSVHPNHLELDREEMLSSKPLLIRKANGISITRNETESRRETDLKRQILQDKKSFESKMDKTHLAMLFTNQG